MATEHSYPVTATATGAVDLLTLDTEIRTLFALDGELQITPTIISFETVEDLGLEDTGRLDAAIAAHAGPDNSPENVKVEIEPRTGQKVQLYSIDFSDPSTWLHTSEPMVNHELVEAQENIWCVVDMDTSVQLVNVSHGKVSFEERYRASHAVVVRDGDGNVLTEHSPNSTWNGQDFSSYSEGDADYAVDYERGRVHVKASHSKPLYADFYKVVDSTSVIGPNPGTTLELLATELQFAVDASLRDTWNFQIRGEVGKDPRLHGVWDATGTPFSLIEGTALEALWNANPGGPGPYPAGTKLPLMTNSYVTVADMVSEANRSYPLIYKTTHPEPSWRDLLEDLQVFRWDYELQAKISLYSKWGNDVRIWFTDHTPIKAWKANVTFYGRSVPEES